MGNNTVKLIINADDFGITAGVTYGILFAHQYGIVSSTTVMVNMPFAKESLKEAKKHPNLGVGLHLVFDAGRPIFASQSSLTSHSGYFLKKEGLMQSAKREDIKNEVEAQLDLAHKWYGNITHIDSHHHLHHHFPLLLDVVLETAKNYNMPVRLLPDTKIAYKIASPDYFCGGFYGEESVSINNLKDMITSLKPGITEMMCHPGFIDSGLYKISSYNRMRMKEVAVLTNNKMKEYMQKQSIELIHYGGVVDGR
ncbi:ChbG/HpnK family deacetylase [Virgibacillus dokdonensis]|uniref:Carbohydrate deacetylase n=1 Tax=Virgibacillus dokdonensis TaxID=302167 RepID=A0A2K9IXN1_9BACI|nr:ChbG/HpnK family deacetylase [Virgibacillus dokdonensis]AUJ23533.1 hypothetical protein A21D_00420 [Virgibacillus dokdonensis]